MTNEKKKELAKDLQEITKKELEQLGELCIKYEIPISQMLELVIEGHKVMLEMAEMLDEKIEIEGGDT